MYATWAKTSVSIYGWNKPDLGKYIQVEVPYMGQVEAMGPDPTPKGGSCGFI